MAKSQPKPEPSEFAKQFNLDNTPIHICAGNMERLRHISKFFLTLAKAEKDEWGQEFQLRKLGLLFQNPESAPLEGTVFKAHWSPTRPCRFTCLFFCYVGGSALFYAVEDRRGEVPIGLIDFGEGFDSGRNLFSYDSGDVADALNIMTGSLNVFEYAAFTSKVDGQGWTWNGRIGWPDWVSGMRRYDTDWIPHLEPTMNRFRPNFQGLPNL
jgi:hypothetical protein